MAWSESKARILALWRSPRKNLFVLWALSVIFIILIRNIKRIIYSFIFELPDCTFGVAGLPPIGGNITLKANEYKALKEVTSCTWIWHQQNLV
jgi:hypothetical protein